MSIPSNAEIMALLDKLEQGHCADDLESYWIDFKPFSDPKDDKKVATEYAVCFANSDGGVVVFGVSDKERGGRSKAIHGSGRVDLAQWERDIYQSTTPSLHVRMEELLVPEGTGRLLVMRVEKGETPPYGTSQGLYKKRVSKNCMPLDVHTESRQLTTTGAIDWSSQFVRGLRATDLDPTEVSRARSWIRKLRPHSDLLQLSEQEFLAGLRAVRDGKVTYTGLILFGRPDMLALHCPQHAVQYVYQSSQTAVTRNDIFQSALLGVLERVEQAFTGPANPEEELSLGFGKLRIPSYPVEDTVREAVLNAVTHRDYLDAGRVLIRHTPTELIITSPGGFIAGITPDNILRHESRTRNQALALAFVKLGLVEQAGVGRRRIFIPMLSYGRRPPLYEADESSVTLRIFGGGYDARMAKLVAKWRHDGHDIDLDGLLILSYLKNYAFIDTYTASQLLQLPRHDVRGLLDRFAQPRTGLLERKGNTAAATFHLTKAISKDLLGKAAYTKTKGIDPIRYSELVRLFVKDHGSITPAECRELLGFGESNTDQVAVSRLFRRWSGSDGFLRREGNPPKVQYYLKEVPGKSV